MTVPRAVGPVPRAPTAHPPAYYFPAFLPISTTTLSICAITARPDCAW
jgi:hypothetical protein